MSQNPSTLGLGSASSSRSFNRDTKRIEIKISFQKVDPRYGEKEYITPFYKTDIDVALNVQKFFKKNRVVGLKNYKNFMTATSMPNQIFL